MTELITIAPAASTEPLQRAEHLDLTTYDYIVVNTSGGKDSSVMAWHVTKLAEQQGVKNRVVFVHATFPEEWADAEDIARKQADQLGVKLHVVTRGEPLLAYVERRKMWPSSKQRYCTSDFKRDPINKFVRGLRTIGRTRVLNCMGLRAQESSNRAKKPVFTTDARQTNSKRKVDQWLPIFRLTEADVWNVIKQYEIPAHPAYARGWKRLSCRICIYANQNTLLAAAWEHPELFKEYVDIEQRIGHSFKADLKLADVWAARERGEKPAGPLDFGKGL